MRTLQRVIFFIAILFCSARFAIADDWSGVYRTSEFLPGSNDNARWKFLSSRLPNILGQSRQDIQNSFGMGSRRRWYCGLPKEDYLEYCISEKINHDGRSICCTVCIYFDNDRVNSVKIDKFTAN